MVNRVDVCPVVRLGSNTAVPKLCPREHSGINGIGLRLHVFREQSKIVDTTPSVLQTQDVDFHHGQDKVDATESSTQLDQSQLEVSTVQANVLPTTPDTMQQASSLMDTPMLDSYPHVRVLDGMPISPHQPSLVMESVTYDHLQATESLKSITPGTWEGMSKYSPGVGGSVLDEDNRGGRGDEDFPTFDKWSVQYMAEQEKQKSEKDKEHTVPQGVTTLAQKKLRHNFAAASCGAKVIASNPEAENINYLLNGNPDEYMLNPCKAKKWFVVELCEPLQIHRVELGTVELFASQPKSFRVFASSRYPTKEWTTLGKYEMSPERVVQSYATVLSEEFVKYVKVEMLEHHGDEHYCPLTAFKVLGIDMADDDFENENEVTEAEGQDSVSDLDEDGVEGSVNLFTSAKDTVVKLVQKVWFKGEQEGSPEKGGKNLQGELPAVNRTEELEEKKGDPVPCVQKDSSSGPTVSIPPIGVVAPASAEVEVQEVPIITKLTDSEQLPMDTREVPVVIKLGSEPDADQPPSVCVHNLWSSYVNMMMLRSQSTSCSSTNLLGLRSLGEKHMDVETVLTDNEIKFAVDKTEGTASEETVSQISVNEQDEEKNKLTTSEASVSTTSSDPVATPESSIRDVSVEVSSDVRLVIESSATADKEASVIAPLPDHHRTQEESSGKGAPEVESSQSSSFTSAGVTVTNSEHLEPSSVSSYKELENNSVSRITPGLHIQKSQVVEQGASDLAETIFLKVSPSPTLNVEDSQEGQDQGFFEMPTAIEKLEDKGPETPVLKELVQGTPSVDTNITEEGLTHSVVEYSKLQNDTVGNGSQVSKASKTIDLVKVGMPSSGKRDNSIMKLNNRIIALEQNVSMTKKYLEELSRVFKQQNEEMMKLLNKTEKRLSVYVAQSDDKNARQQDHIEILEQKVLNLTRTVEDLQVRLEVLDKQVGDSHCLLLFIQMALVLWMVVSTIRGRSKQALTYSDHQFLLDTMPKQPSMETGVRQRRNSDTGPGLVADSSKSVTNLKRQKSDTNIACVGKTDDAGDLHRPFNQEAPLMTKKKKKKKKPLVEEEPVSLQSAALAFPVQTSSFSSSAGVLFGTNSSCPLREGAAAAEGKPPLGKLEGLRSGCCYSVVDNIGQSMRRNSPQLTSDSGRSHILVKEQELRRSSCDEFSSLLDAPPGNGASPRVVQPMSFRNCEENVAASPEFLHPSYHRNRPAKLPSTSCDKCGLKTKPHLRNIRGKHSSLDETCHYTDFVNPNFGQEFFLAENYLQENRFRFLSSPYKEDQEHPPVCPDCGNDTYEDTNCPRCRSSSFLYSFSPKGREQPRTALYPHYPVPRIDVQPLPAVILCPATLTHSVLPTAAVQSHSRQSSFSSTTSSSSSLAVGPRSGNTGYPKSEDDSIHLSSPHHHHPPPPRPPPPVLPTLSSLSIDKAKESVHRDAVDSHSKHDLTNLSISRSSNQVTNHLANGTEQKSDMQHSQKSKSSLSGHAASKSLEKEPQIRHENPKILMKSSSSSLPQGSKSTSSGKKSSITKLPNPFRKS
ncbi:hypothetical protein Btru_025756 [Bulinus truncatus]|nr:hypothetical protein Btru_025756 [Bulinus truncatus]